MKRIIRPFVILFSAMILMASCLSDDNNYEMTYYGDTAITSFSLGTLNRYLTTKSKTEVDENGQPKDSVYKINVAGSTYKFYIDQLKREIYNPDSLPVGTDAAHVICNVGSKNAGIVVINYPDAGGNDSLVYQSSEDSVDFSEPREFRVYSTGATAYRSYKVSVNVHKEDPDSFRWSMRGTDSRFAAMKDMKAVVLGGKVMLFGTDGTSTSIYSTAAADGASWTQLATDVTLGSDVCAGVVAHGGKLFAVDGGRLIASADGQAWGEVTMADGGQPALRRLLGSGKAKLYAMTADGRMASSGTDGTSWEYDGVAGDAGMLPAGDISMGCLPLVTNSNAGRVVMAGNRDVSAFGADTIAVVWNKIEEYGQGSEQHDWIPCNEDNKYQLPRMSGVKILAYGDVLVAIGGSGLGASTAKAFSQIYVSRDYGLTWHSDYRYVLPKDFSNGGSNVFAFAADSDNFLWIISGGTGQVWRGRLNKLGWEDAQTSFTK